MNDLAVETLLKKTCIYLTHNFFKKKKRERELGGWGKLFFFKKHLKIERVEQGRGDEIRFF